MSKKPVFFSVFMGILFLSSLVFQGCENQLRQFILILGMANDGMGSGSIDTVSLTGSGIYDEGTEVSAQAMADSGCSCAGWFDAESGGTLVSADNPYIFNLIEDTVLYAIFENVPIASAVNIHDGGIVESGFIIGTAGDDITLAAVEVKLDGGAYTAATGTTSWSFKLPTGGSTWKDGSLHTLGIRSRDEAGNYSGEIFLHVRKGVNKDVNGDGYADLAVGEYNYNSGQGRAYVFEGGLGGIADQDLSGTGFAETTLTGEANCSFGCSVQG
ncbi:MAG: FG-GAP repeat protein [Spirochaetales bacterium]|nr:FG-GAP repeat protein [Spirochaetales bacterium]